MKKWTWYYSNVFKMYAIFNNETKTISHYEDTRIEAIKICNKWNREGQIVDKDIVEVVE